MRPPIETTSRNAVLVEDAVTILGTAVALSDEASARRLLAAADDTLQ
jgi:hypothetical protein